MSFRYSLQLILVAFACGGYAGFLSAQQPITPGDYVLVTKDNVQLGVRDKPMLAVPAGTEIVVTEVRGNWLGGFTYVEGNKRYGWVHHSEVKLVTPSKRIASSGPVKPDDPQAVEAWKKLGVALHFDEAGNVQVLRAGEAAVQDHDLAHLAGLSSLLSLDLSNQPITDEGMKHVGACRSLQKLYLGNTGVGDAGIAELKNLAALEVLACPKTQVTGQALQHIGSLSELQVVNLDHCAIADDDLAHVGSLPRLEILVLAHTKITDEGLEHLKRVMKLRVLNLDGTTIKGEGLDHLLGLTELRMLYVRQCPVEIGVTDRLDDKLPGLAIYD